MNNPQIDNSLSNTVSAIDYSKALDIANAHVVNPKYEHVRAWYHVGRNNKFDLESIKDQFEADSVNLSFAYYTHGNNFFTRRFEFSNYDISIENPTRLPSALVIGDKKYPVVTLKVFNAGNIEFAGILFEQMRAIVKPDFFPELKEQGFQCWEATKPGQPIYNGPFKNVFTLEEEFGPTAAQWLKEGNTVIINKKK